jgi:DAACS family dicarboxylate/amino acid:cation (Na+ or H+) symporter
MDTGIPAAGLGILLAMDAIPDMLRTTLNVTGDQAVAAILSRGAPAASAGDAAPDAAPRVVEDARRA